MIKLLLMRSQIQCQWAVVRLLIHHLAILLHKRGNLLSSTVTSISAMTMSYACLSLLLTKPG